jgi:hypothetical protein
MFLRLTSSDHRKQVIIPRGLCAPEATEGLYEEKWRISQSTRIADGDYDIEAVFVDNTRRAWANLASGDSGTAVLSSPIFLGKIKVASGTKRLFQN